MRKRILGVIATTALIMSGGLLSGAGTASAADGPWAVCTSGSSLDCKAGQALSARGRTIDADNSACVDDMLADGHSAVLVVWPAGQYEQRREIWETHGVGNRKCDNARILLGVPEDTLLGYKVCIGESGPMTILSCGSVETAYI